MEVCLRFGVALTASSRTIAEGLRLDFSPGTITLIAGPSGSGKSLLLESISRRFPTARTVNRIAFPLDVAVVDAVAPTRPVSEALAVLTACGMGEPGLWIRRFDQLSDGERFRARLARAVSLHGRDGGSAPLLCDEFGALLHRRAAQAIAFNLRKMVTRQRLCLAVATSRDDIERDLRPDRVVRLGGDGVVVEDPAGAWQKGTGTARNGSLARRDVTRRGASPLLPRVSFARRLRIERGTLRDYERFASMHYRRRVNTGFIDKVFVMREGVGGEALGVVVYGRGPLELSMRNRATCGRFVRQSKRLNRECRMLKRLVVHPDVRGCGLGHWLVARTLPEVGTPFVECLAAMGMVNPVFEKAGMRAVGVCPAPAERDRAVAALRAAGADPVAADFVTQVCRRASVRRIVAGAVQAWYRVTTGGGETRVQRQSPSFLAHTFRQLAGSEPVYFIWAREPEGWALIERGLAEVRSEK